MRLLIKSDCRCSDGGFAQRGNYVDVPADEGIRLIQKNQAEPAERKREMAVPQEYRKAVL